MKGFELWTFLAFDGALDVRLLGDLGRSWIVAFFTCFVVFALLCIRRTFLGAVARPRWDPAALGGGWRPSGGGEPSPRGESLRHCERRQRPGASTGRCDGLLMVFAFLSDSIVLLLVITLHLITFWRLFCYWTLRLPVVSSQSVKVS